MREEIKCEDGEVWVGNHNITESINKLFDEVEALMVNRWSGTVTETNLTAIQMHEKIMDDSREYFNQLKNKWVHGIGSFSEVKK